ncbi:MAG: hypothetical protein LBK07_00220 [Tannerella sp.]|jgi:hypothetical protein|nr:hypothetical protein [Tannerella sp.]
MDRIWFNIKDFYYNFTDVDIYNNFADVYISDSVAVALAWIVVTLSVVMNVIFFSSGKEAMEDGAFRVFTILLLVVSILELLMYGVGERALWFLREVGEAPVIGDNIGRWFKSTGQALVGYAAILVTMVLQLLCARYAIASMLARAGYYRFKWWQWLLIIAGFFIPFVPLIFFILLWRKSSFLTAVRCFASILVIVAALVFMASLSMEAVGNILFLLILVIPFYGMIMGEGAERVADQGDPGFCSKHCLHWNPDTPAADRTHHCKIGNRVINEFTKIGHCQNHS